MANPPFNVFDQAGAFDSNAKLLGPGPYFQGGRRRNVERMIDAMSAFRDEGQLPGAAALALSQLLLNLGGRLGRARAVALVDEFLDECDLPVPS